MTNGVKVQRYFLGLSNETNIFYFKVKVTPDLQNAYLDGLVVRIGLYGTQHYIVAHAT